MTEVDIISILLNYVISNVREGDGERERGGRVGETMRGQNEGIERENEDER